MSRFDQHLKNTRQQSNKAFLLLAAGFGVVFVVYFGWLFLTRGYEINVKPDEAAPQAQVSVVSGFGMQLFNRVYSMGGELQVEVSSPFYEPATVAITGGSPSFLEVTLNPIPLQIKAQVNEPNDDIQWFIDGVQVYQGAQLAYEVAKGTYRLEIKSPYHRPYSTSIEIKQPSLEALEFELLAEPVELSVRSQPAGAKVTFNGQEQGMTPLKFATKSGVHEIRFDLEGYEVLSETVELPFDKGVNQSRSYSLEPLKATLQIQANPSDGTLLLNGKQVPLGDQTIYSNREYTVVYERAGYSTFRTSLKLAPGQAQPIQIELTEQFGQVVFESNVQATVTVGGKVLGTTPLTTQLNTADQVVQFSAPGYMPMERKFKPSTQRSLRIEAKMLTEDQAKLAARGKPLAQELGMRFVRFNMESFMMGSPANQRGRYRNEFEYRVTFSRPVLVARHEVTEAQYAAFKPSVAKSDNPVTNVSWNDAALYANWLSTQDGLKLFYQVQGSRVVGFNSSANGYRLLSEAEWEYVAKMSGRAAASKYVWGDQERIPADFGNYGAIAGYSDQHGGVAPVGSYKAERSGIHDLSGNVSEWVNDFMSFSVPSGNTTNYLGPRSGDAHVVKGGSFQTSRIELLRPSYRDSSASASPAIGFRLARYE